MTAFSITLPDWAVEGLVGLLEDRMAAVIRFSRLNFEHAPRDSFLDGISERESGRGVTIGISRVVPSNCSAAHAESGALSVVAVISRAQMPFSQFLFDQGPRLALFDLHNSSQKKPMEYTDWSGCE